MTVTADQIGKLYDILIATRDGSTLACIDHNGRTQQVSQVAYMLSTTRPSTEATEIQRKDQLVQLSSAQMIDRDFDAYPQVEQGDWSDGQGQRVFSGQGQAAGTISNKSTAYWDGLGVLWPLNDYLPQQMVALPPKVLSADTLTMIGPNFQPGGIGPGPAVAAASSSTTQAKWFAIALDTTTSKVMVYQFSADTITSFDVSAVIPNTHVIDDFFSAFGYLWACTHLSTNPNSGQLVANLTGTPVVVNSTFSRAASFSSVGTGLVGLRSYIAVPIITGGGTVFLFDVTNTQSGSPIGNAVVPILLDTNVFAGQCEFDGGRLLIACQVGSDSVLLGYDIATQTSSTVALFRGYNQLGMTAIAGGVFIVAIKHVAPISGGAADVEMYLLQGNNLQDIGPLTVQIGTGTSAFVSDVMRPTSFGPYAILAAIVGDNAGNSYVQIFCYDVLRGRLFKAGQQPFTDASINANRTRLAVFTVGIETYQGAQRLFKWGVTYNALPGASAVANLAPMQEMVVGIANAANSQPIQQGCQIISSLIDFTSGQNKLYRQLVADFTALPNDAGISVQLDCWFDQDPSSLAATPDFTTGVVAGGNGNTGVKQIKLVTNKIARKAVYRITTTGPSATATPAVKVISVKVQLATGWSLHYFLDIARNAQCNDSVTGSPTYCFDNQRPVDDFCAHAFLKQLWRLKGGECTVTLPTGETYNAIMQLISAENVKHVIQSALSDTPVVKSVIVELKIREDI